MKPPPRVRNKPNRPLPADAPGRLSCKWNRVEKRTLRDALERLSKTAATDAEIDYSFVGKRLPKRSVAEIRSVIDDLKNKAIANVAAKLKKRKYDERGARKPIEEWAHLASSLAGSLEGTLETVFSQVLNVSSTEPCTLKNCDPPRDLKSSTSFGPPVRIIPLKPTTLPPPRVGSSRKPRAQKNPICPPQKNPGTSLPPATGEAPPTSDLHTSQLPSEDNPSAPPSALGQPPSSAQSDSTAGKAEDPQRVMEAKQIVDFERIYKYLSVIHKPEEESHLTSMENAIVLDLLMSLPEELPLLDCKGLHKHMMKMKQCLTAPADSVIATQLLSQLKDGGCTLAAQQSGGASGGEAAGGDQPPAGSSSSQSQDFKKNRTVPPLNPFMVPLSLLVRQEESTNWECCGGVRTSLF